MTVPHPRAVDSLGAEFAAWALERSGFPLRWWQRLVATRLLEVDEAGVLVWEAVVWSVARQLGKSWLLRELILWRIHQGGRFGERQNVVHTGKDLQVCQEIQDDAKPWARERPDLYKISSQNGKEAIEYLPDRSKWMLRAKESAYGLSVSVAAVDEAWKVRPETLDESVVPTMVARVQPQLWLVSTAHRLATQLMVKRRLLAMDQLETADGDLLIEWSAAATASVDDRDGWRAASPFWESQRERHIGRQLGAARAGEIVDDDETDPEQSFRAQWLNQWPRKVTLKSNMEDLLPEGLWEGLAEPGLVSDGPVIVAMEDDYGRGAAIGACARLDDGRIEVDGRRFDSWDSAVAWVERLHMVRPVVELYVGASLLDRVPRDGSFAPRPVGMTEARAGLAVFRDLAASGMLVHDKATELSEGFAQTQVRESPSGLVIAKGPAHLVKAVVWAVAAAHRPARVPAIY